MDKVLVTGGAGFVGFGLVGRLLAMGQEVVVIGRHASPEVVEAGAEMITGDIRDCQFLQQVSKGCDAVFHVAAKAGVWGSWQDYYDINVLGTENVIAACRQNSIGRLIYTSTPSVVFSGDDIIGAGEDIPYAEKFLCHYARSKCLAEKLVVAANNETLKTVSLRPHLIWGPGDTNLIPRIVSRGRQGLLRQVGDGSNMVDISYIDNVVDAHIQADEDLSGPERSAGKAYFISQGDPVNLWQWINGLLVSLDIKLISKKISFTRAYWGGAMLEGAYGLAGIKKEPLMTRFVAEQLAKSHWFSIDRARTDFGYKPAVSTVEGMKRLVEWLKR